MANNQQGLKILLKGSKMLMAHVQIARVIIRHYFFVLEEIDHRQFHDTGNNRSVSLHLKRISPEVISSEAIFMWE